MDNDAFWKLIEQSKATNAQDFSALKNKIISVNVERWLCDTLEVQCSQTTIGNFPLRNIFNLVLGFLKHHVTPVFVVYDPTDAVANDAPHQRLRDECCALLRWMGVMCIKSRLSVDAVCAMLNQQKLVHGVVTNSSEAFLYGAQVVYKDFTYSKKQLQHHASFTAYNIDDFLSMYKLTPHDLPRVALLSGLKCPTALFNFLNELTATDEPLNCVQRFAEWKNNDAYYDEVKAISRAKQPQHCTICKHPGSTSVHEKSGCGSCGTSYCCHQATQDVRCTCDYHVALRRYSTQKHELVLRQHALRVEGFPCDDLIQKYQLNRVQICSSEDLQWRKPNCDQLRKFLMEKLHMPEESIPFYVDQLMTLYSQPRITAPLLAARDHVSCDQTRDDTKENVANGVTVLSPNTASVGVCTPSTSHTSRKFSATSSNTATVSVYLPSTPQTSGKAAGTSSSATTLNVCTPSTQATAKKAAVTSSQKSTTKTSAGKRRRPALSDKDVDPSQPKINSVYKAKKIADVEKCDLGVVDGDNSQLGNASQTNCVKTRPLTVVRRLSAGASGDASSCAPSTSGVASSSSGVGSGTKKYEMPSVSLLRPKQDTTENGITHREATSRQHIKAITSSKGVQVPEQVVTCAVAEKSKVYDRSADVQRNQLGLSIVKSEIDVSAVPPADPQVTATAAVAVPCTEPETTSIPCVAVPSANRQVTATALAAVPSSERQVTATAPAAVPCTEQEITSSATASGRLDANENQLSPSRMSIFKGVFTKAREVLGISSQFVQSLKARFGQTSAVKSETNTLASTSTASAAFNQTSPANATVCSTVSSVQDQGQPSSARSADQNEATGQETATASQEIRARKRLHFDAFSTGEDETVGGERAQKRYRVDSDQEALTSSYGVLNNTAGPLSRNANNSGNYSDRADDFSWPTMHTADEISSADDDARCRSENSRIQVGDNMQEVATGNADWSNVEPDCFQDSQELMFSDGDSMDVIMSQIDIPHSPKAPANGNKTPLTTADDIGGPTVHTADVISHCIDEGARSNDSDNQAKGKEDVSDNAESEHFEDRLELTFSDDLFSDDDGIEEVMSQMVIPDWPTAHAQNSSHVGGSGDSNINQAANCSSYDVVESCQDIFAEDAENEADTEDVVTSDTETDTCASTVESWCPQAYSCQDIFADDTVDPGTDFVADCDDIGAQNDDARRSMTSHDVSMCDCVPDADFASSNRQDVFAIDDEDTNSTCSKASTVYNMPSGQGHFTMLDDVTATAAAVHVDDDTDSTCSKASTIYGMPSAGDHTGTADDVTACDSVQSVLESAGLGQATDYLEQQEQSSSAGASQSNMAINHEFPVAAVHNLLQFNREVSSVPNNYSVNDGNSAAEDNPTIGGARPAFATGNETESGSSGARTPAAAKREHVLKMHCLQEGVMYGLVCRHFPGAHSSQQSESSDCSFCYDLPDLC